MKEKICVYIIFMTCLIACKFDAKENSPIDQHSINNVLRHYGTYKGSMPCDHCDGIAMVLTLNPDETFDYRITYWGEKDRDTVHKGTYIIKDSLLIIKQNINSKYFLLRDQSLLLLGNDSKSNSGNLANHYSLKKQAAFNYHGNYESYKLGRSEHPQILSIKPFGKDYKIQFSSSDIKNRENCWFQGIAKIKNDTLWVHISEKKDKVVQMYITPSHDHLGIEVSTSDFSENHFVMRFCTAASSLVGKYLKNTITSTSLNMLNKQTTLAEVMRSLPEAQIQKKINAGEFAENLYSDYEIYNDDGDLLFTLTTKDTADVHQKINTIKVNSPFFKTDKGITAHSTFGEIKDSYHINGFSPTRAHISFYVDEINAIFSISKSKLLKDWWNEDTKSINENKIPMNAQIDEFVLWWIDKPIMN